MNAILAWVLGAIALTVLVTAFWVLFRYVLLKPAKALIQNPDFPREEFAEEITFPTTKTTEDKPRILSDTPHIPWSYGMDRIVLMVRDPNWIFAYWEITATKQEEFNSQYGPEAWNSSRPILRVYDITGLDCFNGKNANNFMDISINEYVDSWHVEVARPNSSFCVDLGRIFPDGTFVTLLRSNVVQTPSLSVSNLLDEEWMWIEGVYRTITKLRMGSSPMVSEDITGGMGIIPLGISSPGMNEKNH